MKRLFLAVVLASASIAGVAWSVPPVTVIEDVVVGSVVDDDVFLLQDGRRLVLNRPIDKPEALVGRSIRVIARVDPQIAGQKALFADILRIREAPGVSFSKDGEEVDIEGTVTELGSSSFGLSTALGIFQVVIDEDTEFHDLEGIAGLAVGDLVRVKGELEGAVILADEVRALEEEDDDDNPSGVIFESLGQITSLPESDHIALDDSRTYISDDQTSYSDGLHAYDDLIVGMMIEIKALRDTSGINRALEVKMQSDGAGVTEFEGQIQNVDLAGFDLVNGPRVEVVPSTVFDGDADRLADLQQGWMVEVKAYQVMGEFRALEVDADDPGAASTSGEEFEPNQALVVLAAGVVPNLVADRYDAVVIGEIGDVAALFWWEEEIDDQLLILMNSDPEIAAVEPNYVFRDPESVRRRYVVVDREHHDEEYTDQEATSLTKLATARLVADGAGSVVAVLDTGVDPEHPVLLGKLLDGGLDLVDGDDEPWESRDGIDQDLDGDVDEAAGHGTFVSSLVMLVAPGARILPYRVLDDDGGGSAYLLSLALADAIARQVDIISLSLVYHRRSAAVDLLLEMAGSQGISVVAAAGNDGSSILPFPASDRHVIAVTGLGADGTGLASFANRSPEAWLAAPSDGIYGAVDGSQWGTWSGTSMAVPFVAGALAIFREIDPGIDSAVSAELLHQTGKALSDGGWTGVGLDLGRAVQQLYPVVERRPSTPAERR